MKRALQTFEVAIKGFVVRDDGALLLVRESVGALLWELPGGRIDVGEERLPQTEVLRRELREELGEGLLVDLERPLLTWIRPRERDFVFVVGFLCRLRGGEVRLSDEHVGHAWVTEESAAALPLAPGYAETLQAFWRLQLR